MAPDGRIDLTTRVGSVEEMAVPEIRSAAHDLNGPTYVHAILTTEALLAAVRAH